MGKYSKAIYEHDKKGNIMKIFKQKVKYYTDGYKKKVYFLGIPVVHKIRKETCRKIYLFGIKIYHKRFKQPCNTCIIQIDKNFEYVQEVLNKAIEKHLQSMRQFKEETENRLNKIEKKLK